MMEGTGDLLLVIPLSSVYELRSPDSSLVWFDFALVVRSTSAVSDSTLID